jgi:hypothetical protein
MKPSSDTKWYEPPNHVVKLPTIKIVIRSWKAKKYLIGVWHSENLPHDTNTIGMK